jgi:phage terminase large subunit-like protein
MLAPAEDRWSTACPDWKERILAGESLIPSLPLFEEEAERALRVFRRLRVPDLVGTPTYGEICGEWTFDFVRALFGCYDPKKRRRMIREFFLLIPKKNGKSSIAAAIMVTAAIINRRPAAELLLIAPTKKIADIAFKQAAGIIRLDPELAKIFYPQTHQRTITHRLTDAQILIKAADADVITGSKATFILVDETHVFSKKAKAADIFVEIRGSLASRPDGFLLQITTQSKDAPAGVFRSELNIARDVRDGKVRLPLLAVLYELPPEVAANGGWKDRTTWPLINPNLNRSVDEAFLADELTKAEREGAEQLQLIASQHFNVEVGLSLASGRWRGADYWQAAGDPTLTLDALLARSEVVTFGGDGGGLDDLLGAAVFGREKVTRRWLLWCHAFAHEKVLELRKDIAANLRDFEKEGSLTVCATPSDLMEKFGALFARVAASGLLPKKDAVGLDPNNVAAMIEALNARGMTDEMLRRLLQGPALSPAWWGMEMKLADGTLSHSGSALMDWVVGNAKVEPRGNGILITKQISGRAKIDPLIAAGEAAILMSWNPASAQSIYETRGALVL